MTTLGRAAARIAAGLMALAIIMVPVVVVAVLVGNPIPAGLFDKLGHRNLDDASIVKLLSLGFYVCWAWFCGPALRQLTASRQQPATRPPPSQPAPPTYSPARPPLPAATDGPRGALARLIRFAVTGTAMVTIAAGPGQPVRATPATHAVATAPTVAAVVAPANPGDVTTPSDVDTVTSVAARNRDTPYAVAVRYLPDRADDARDEILTLNRGRPLPDGSAYQGGTFPAGWEVLIPQTAHTVTEPSPARDETSTTPSADDSTGKAATHRVVAGDSYWSIADTQLRTELGREPSGRDVLAYTEALVDHNASRLGYSDRRMLHAGDVVEHVTPPAPAEAPSMEPVRPGDSYWAITTRVLGPDATAGQVLDGTEQLKAFNAPRLGYRDPNMLHPGDLVDTSPLRTGTDHEPDIATPRTSPPRQPHDERHDTRERNDRRDRGDRPDSDVGVEQPDASPELEREHPVVETPAAPPRPAAEHQPAETEPVAAEDAGSVDEHADGVFEFSSRTVWWQLPIGLLLAAGVVAQVRRLRGRRAMELRPGEQLATPPPVAAGVELAAATAAPGSRLATLQGLLRSVTPHARELDDPPPVRAVSVDEERIEILFVDPAPFPPPGWSTVDGGRSWVYRVNGDVPVTVRQLLTPSLVTVGRRPDGGELLLDVETAGSVGLAGDRQAALGLARSMTLELATYPLGVPMDVLLVGLDVDGTENCDRTWSRTTLPRAVRVARETLERQAATGAASLMAARAATDDDAGLLDPAVFVVDTDTVTTDDEQALLDELVELCQLQTGAAAILVGPRATNVRETVTLDSVAAARWLGVELRPPVVDREAVAQLAVTLEHAANAPAEPVVASPVVEDLLAAERVADDVGPLEEPLDPDSIDPDVMPYRYEPPDHDVMVQLLDEVTVHGVNLTTAPDVELLALLTSLRGRKPNIDTITTLLDRERPLKRLNDADEDADDDDDDDKPLTVKAVRSRLSRLRTKMGVGSDDEPLIPSAKVGRGSPGRYSVSNRIVTDIDLIQHRYLTSRELTSHDALVVLRDGLALFTGPPFRSNCGYDWPGPEGVLLRVYAVIRDYAARLMELAMERDDLALVLETVGRTAAVIDDPLHLQPVRVLEQQYAELTGDPDLAASVAEARRRLREFADENDRITGS